MTNHSARTCDKRQNDEKNEKNKTPHQQANLNLQIEESASRTDAIEAEYRLRKNLKKKNRKEEKRVNRQQTIPKGQEECLCPISRQQYRSRLCLSRR
jgi:hypothetical protein